MEVKKGTRRLVVLFPKLGFVVKFAQFPIRATLRAFLWYCSEKNWILLKRWFRYDVEVLGGFKCLMYKGIHDNWNEYKLYQETHNVFLQPTYFSFLGLINIQRYGKIQEYGLGRLSAHFGRITGWETSKDSHHFANYQNFCIENDKVRVLDYGSKRTQGIILKWGEKIVSEFNLHKLTQEEESKS